MAGLTTLRNTLEVPDGLPIEDLLLRTRIFEKTLTNDKLEKIYAKFDKQVKEEARLIPQKLSCPEGSNIDISQVKVTELNKLLIEHFDNPEIMKLIHCIFSGLSKADELRERSRINYWIKKLRLVASGSTAAAYRAKLGPDESPNLILKVQTDPKRLEFIHELFVGLFGTNSLREEGNLNFSYVYGGFSCTPPLVGPESDIPITWCDKKEPFHYILYEDIVGNTLTNQMAEMEPETFFNLLVQVVLSLSDAYKKIDYTHYDLHTSNLIVKPLGEKYSIAYDTPNGEIFLTTENLAVFIDYGLSHIKYNGKNYGCDTGAHVGVMMDKAFPMYDIFKLLLSSYQLSGKVKTQVMIRNFLRFFSGENPEMLFFILRQDYDVSWLPYLDEFKDITYDTFWIFLKANFGEYMTFISEDPKAKILGCGHKACQTSIEIREKVLTGAIPMDPFEIYDMSFTLNKLELQKVLKRYDVKYGVDLIRVNYIADIKALDRLEMIQVPDLRGVSSGIIMNFDFEKRYIDYLMNIAKIIKLVNSFEIIKLVNQWFWKTFNKGIDIDLKRVENLERFLEQNLLKIDEEHSYLIRLKNKNLYPLLKLTSWFL